MRKLLTRLLILLRLKKPVPNPAPQGGGPVDTPPPPGN